MVNKRTCFLKLSFLFLITLSGIITKTGVTEEYSMCIIKMGDISWWELSVKERIHSHHDERQGIYFSIRNVCSTCKSEREKFQLPKAARLRTAQDIPDSFYVVCTVL